MNRHGTILITGCTLLLLTACGPAPQSGMQNAVAPGSTPTSVASTQTPLGSPSVDPDTIEAKDKGKRRENVQDKLPGNGKTLPVNEPARGVPTRQALTAPQKAFVREAGANGVEPGAILEAGTAACGQLEFLQRIDPDVALGSIISEEVPNAEEAIKYLCPKYVPLATEAVVGFGDGTFTVAQQPIADESIARGKYSTVSTGPECTWQVYNGKGRVIDDGEAGKGNGKGKGTMKVGPQAERVTSNGCYAWVPSKR